MKKKDFSKRKEEVKISDLLELQLKSFYSFLQYDTPPSKRKKEGLQEVFEEVFPIEDIHRNFRLEFVEYDFAEPQYTPEEALEKGTTYARPLKVTLRLVKKGLQEEVKDIIEEEVYLCELPFMTPNASFIINGVERCVVNQLTRSPGVYFSSGNGEYSALLVPERGPWIEFVVDRNNIAWAILDRRRRIPIVTFLKALGLRRENLFTQFFNFQRESPKPGRILAEEVRGEDGIVYAQAGDVITEEGIAFLRSKGITEVALVAEDEPAEIIQNSLRYDKTENSVEAIKWIYTRLRSIAPHSIEAAKAAVLGLLFDNNRFNLGRVGRYKLNSKLGTKFPITHTGLTEEDVFRIIKGLLYFATRRIPPDDMDHLANRRVKQVGELLREQFRAALLALSQAVKERAAFVEEASATPSELINARIVSTVIMKFFTSSQLCQFLEQVNPLSELTHKRRVSALGPGGLTKKTAGFEVRDIHYSHYGRICPIETPEGPTIGLTNYLAIHSRIDEYGFITTPYRRVENGRVTRKIEYLNPEEEEKYTIVPADTPMDKKTRRLIGSNVLARRGENIISVPPTEVDYIDISSRQVFSPSSNLIPFLEHDDADRALMGANMQRQAVPLLQPERPLVATGVEGILSKESKTSLFAEESGVVVKVDASSILIREEKGFREYRLKKFAKTNQYTCINQKPRVREGDKVKKGDLLADGPATDRGELALGRNVLVAFMPFWGYNYEDAIVVSEDLLRDDKFTSVQILEFEIQARETKLGSEEITRDVPGATEEEVKELDEYGIIRVGAEVSPGDILVGRITPKGETELTPEERLLWAIFGEKATNVRDSSLRVEPGVYGTVIERRIFSRKTQDPLARHLERERLLELDKRIDLERSLILERRNMQLRDILIGEKSAQTIRSRKGKILIKEGEPFTEDFLSSSLNKIHDFNGILRDPQKMESIREVIEKTNRELEELEDKRLRERTKIQRGDELPYGVLKMVKVYIAQRRHLSVGDKMSGRHGNKGVVAKILPREDMPYLEDGTRIEIVVNTLGVPSRMNIGQILETHLGWAAKILGYQAITPIFGGATISEIKDELKKAGLPEDGKAVLYDGRTGLPFDNKAVVGYMYMMKLIHMVDDKIHARSTGKYSLITQQPLGGKAQFGGQRFGEMEVWALEGYGAAYTLQEMLTVKSDDVEGRSALYEALIKGKSPPPPKTPASFNVLVKELQGLGLELVPEKERDGF